MSTAIPASPLWEELDKRLQSSVAAQEGVWTGLSEASGPSSYRPIQASGVVYRRLDSGRGDAYYMLNNPDAGTYLRLDEKDFYMWSLMDGTRSVKDLVVAYFSEYASIAFERVNDLVSHLRAANFLTDTPVDIYAEVDRRCRRGTLRYWVEALWRAFLRKEFAINGIDGFIGALYRRVFWVFFSKPALLIYPGVVVSGLGLFFYTIQLGTYPILEAGGKWYWGLLTFLGANLVVILVREAAHAFATKRYGRRVRRGGLLVYLGGPAFFVDTMDIWMEPKRSRIAVSWAGPYSGLLVGSVCMLAIAGTGFSDAGVNEVLFKGAIWAFVFGAIINLNPLLEFNGYYILIDWLEIPMLRKRSMEFVRRNLFNKLINRKPFSREERIFGVFGGACADLYRRGDRLGAICVAVQGLQRP